MAAYKHRGEFVALCLRFASGWSSYICLAGTRECLRTWSICKYLHGFCSCQRKGFCAFLKAPLCAMPERAANIDRRSLLCVPVNWNCRGDEFLISPGAPRLLFAAFILIRKGSCWISKESSLCQCKLRELLWIFHFTDIRTHSRRFMLERHAFLRLKRQKLISVGSSRVVAMKTRRQVLALRWVKYLFFWLAVCNNCRSTAI